jgi:hypothetical protein
VRVWRGLLPGQGNFAQQTLEFVGAQEFGQLLHVRGAQGQGLKGQLRAGVCFEPGQLAVQEHVVHAAGELLAEAFGQARVAGGFGFAQGLQGGKVVHDLEGGLGADAGQSGDVVRRIAHESLQIRPLRGADAHFRKELGLAGDLLVLARRIQRYTLGVRHCLRSLSEATRTTGRWAWLAAARLAMQSSASTPSLTMSGRPRSCTASRRGSICAARSSGILGRWAL